MSAETEEAAQAWLESIEVPPMYSEGKVHYPEGPVEMTVEEYIGFHGMCLHDAQSRLFQIQVLKTYLEVNWLCGPAVKRALAPCLRVMALATGRPEYLEVPWER